MAHSFICLYAHSYTAQTFQFEMKAIQVHNKNHHAGFFILLNDFDVFWMNGLFLRIIQL